MMPSRRRHTLKTNVGGGNVKEKNGNGPPPVTRENESWKNRKLVEIHQALNSDPVDVEALRRAASSEGGLLADDLRRRVWPKLLNINVYDLPYKPARDVRQNHKDYNQVLLDVRRSTKRFPKGMPASERAVLQEQLIDLMLEVLKNNPQLHYYQGYHDVAVTILLVVGIRPAVAILHTLSNHHLRDFMDPTMDSTKHILNYLMPILERVDTELHHFMVREKEVKRTECDMAMVHHLLSRIPQDLPYELLIGRSQALFDQYPPSLLARQAALQSHKSLCISTFQSFQLSTLHQRPDSVLRRQREAQSNRHASGRPGLQPALQRDVDPVWGQGRRMVKMAVWGLSATLGAAVFAVAQTAMDWGPEALLQLF